MMKRRLLAAAALAAVVPAVGQAQTTQNRFGGSATATIAYSNNPFSEANGDNASSPLVILDVTPVYQHLTERSILSVTGDANLQQYFKRYGRNDSYSGSVDYSLRPAERISTHLRLDLSSAVLGSFNSFVPPFATVSPPAVDDTTATGVGAPLPGATTVPGAAAGANALPASTALFPSSPLLTDVGLYGLRNRRRTGRVEGDTGIGVTQRDSVTLSAYAEATRYGDVGDLALGDYEAYSGSVGYQRRVSAYINLGVQGSASLFDYRNTPSTHVYSIAATASGRLSEHWSLDGSLGVSFVDGGEAGSTRKTSPSGSLNLCRQGQHSSMCAQVSRQVSPTGLEGSQYSTTAGLNWSDRLSARDGLSLSANYSQIGGDDRLLLPGGVPFRSKYGQATVGYDRTLRQRLRFVASANVRQLFGDGGGDRPADYGGQVGLAYQFGDLR